MTKFDTQEIDGEVWRFCWGLVDQSRLCNVLADLGFAENSDKLVYGEGDGYISARDPQYSEEKALSVRWVETERHARFRVAEAEITPGVYVMGACWSDLRKYVETEAFDMEETRTADALSDLSHDEREI